MTSPSVFAWFRVVPLLTLLCCGGWVTAQTPAAPQPPQSLGELLYSTHCVACHTTQMHWRNNKLATDWASLKAQVRNWQGRARLDWTDADVNEVARYLNDTIYKFPQTAGQVGLVSQAGSARSR